MKGLILDKSGKPIDYGKRDIYRGVVLSDSYKRLPNYNRPAKELTTHYSRQQLVSASRLLYRTNGVVKGAINLKTEYSIGKAFKYRALIDDGKTASEYNKYIQDFYKVACVDGLNFHSLLYKISTAIDVDGEAFVLLTQGRSGFPQLQFIEGCRVYSHDSGRIAKGHYQGYYVSDGIIHNKQGREVAYIVDLDDDGGRIIPATAMIHCKDVDFLDGGRGEPLFSHGIKAFRLLDEINDAELGAMKIASQIALIKKNESGEPDLANLYGSTPSGGPVEVAGTGDKQIVYLRSDEQLDSLRVERPTPNYMNFSERLLKCVLSGVGVPYDIVVNPDSGGVGNRMSLSKFDNTARDRATLIEELANRVIQYVLATAIDAGDLPHVDGWYNMSFSKAKRPSVDLGRDASTQLKEYDAGVKNLTEICDESGVLVEDHLQERAREVALMEQARIAAEQEYKVTIDRALMRTI